MVALVCSAPAGAPAMAKGVRIAVCAIALWPPYRLGVMVTEDDVAISPASFSATQANVKA